MIPCRSIDCKIEGSRSKSGLAPVCLGLPEVETADSQVPLKIELEGKLNDARVIHRSIHYPEASSGVDVLHPAAAATHEELGMVEDIEELSPELHHHAFAERQGKVLDGGEIRVHKSRSVNGSAWSIAKLSRGCFFKCARVKPVCQGVNLIRRRTRGVGGHRPRLVWISHLVGPVQAVAIPLEIYSSRISTVDGVAIYNEEWKSRGYLFNYVYLPISEDCVGSRPPIAAETLTLAKWQVVDHASSELLIEVQLGKAPV